MGAIVNSNIKLSIILWDYKRVILSYLQLCSTYFVIEVQGLPGIPKNKVHIEHICNAQFTTSANVQC